MTAPAQIELDGPWEVARTRPGDVPDARGTGSLSWGPAQVPGTVAAVADDGDPDAHDWWFRTTFAAEPVSGGEQALLRLGGIATVAEVYLNGTLILESESMFATHAVDIGGRLQTSNELTVCCRALAPRLRERRKPRARWRTRLVAEGNLRFYRTMLLGRAPGFAPGPAVVGLWRPVAIERRRGSHLESVRLRPRLCGGHGVLECRAAVRVAGEERLPERLTIDVRGPTGALSGELAIDPHTGEGADAVEIAGAEPWWPHTHGPSTLYEVSLRDGERVLHTARVGFRRLQAAADLEADGLRLRINDVPVFVRGAVWTPLSLREPHAVEAGLRAVLERVVDAGMNMLRIPGIAAYESDDFYDLCDELGILVWQDFMFANLDYPEQDAEFMRTVRSEATVLLDRIGARPSLAVLCGGSEVAQQVAMLGLDPALAAGPLYAELLPGLVAEAAIDAPYIPSTPWGGALPFRPGRGVANYYGVGAYLRPLEDARRAEVRFAGECLAFANVPDDAALADLDAPGGLSVNHPAWKAGIPRDAGAGWDFEDVRDHYLRLLYDLDPVALRWTDQARYLELSRMVTGEVMAETFGEWRRGGSPCCGALVLWLKDLAPGAGWGVLDHRGEPKVVYHHVRRALAPVAVWTTDEGLGGIAVHVANDGPAPVRARLRIALYRDCQALVDEASETIELLPHSVLTRDAETMLGRFVDAAWAYRFGPPGHDLVAVSLEPQQGDGAEPISQSFRFPVARPLQRLTAEALGLTAAVEAAAAGEPALRIRTDRFAYGVRVMVPGYRLTDDAFGIEPGHERHVRLVPDPRGGTGNDGETGGWLAAVNLAGRLRVPVAEGVA